ncbi:MAG TPA: Ni/Fe-hydrogenase cytochrome b subunit [Bryobacteraceae bacterium]|jgi:Ni/Fe-hydrogenase subunit HybB-like protein|nr:Ni/Fe-hydrogenase cytochrome b subunit [Bryobacteraceae bacterium]
MTRKLPKITVWRAIFAAILLSGLYATYLRVFYGLGGSTNLSDKFPWGIWIAFDVMCGVGLAAGGFTLVAIVHIFRIERYQPVLRPAILTAFLGYSLVVVGLLYDLGRPDRLWHPLVMWNPHSVMFEVAWCVTLYTTVLFLEFLPVVFEKFGMHKPLEWIHRISVPLMILGVLLSTLHQSSLGTLFLIVPEKLYPLWYTPILPLLFYVSAIAVGLAMTIFESWHSSRAFGRALELPLLASLARVLAVVLSVYLWIRFLDMSHRHVFGLLSQNRIETWLFALEIALTVVPTVLLYQARIRLRPGALYACAVMVVFGFIANRLNVGTTGLEAGSGTHYIPKWSEVAITLSIVAAGFATFRLIAQYFPIFEAHSYEPAPAETEANQEDPVTVG